ncbi:hypothetical protein FHY02_003702 [Sphingomonas sp. BK069]|nr:hypothetical protein [Sphingomonas sp. BK069]MBB3474337.1 hypothetical protein [Sphingomonas sp. BK345]
MPAMNVGSVRNEMSIRLDHSNGSGDGRRTFAPTAARA